MKLLEDFEEADILCLLWQATSAWKTTSVCPTAAPLTTKLCLLSQWTFICLHMSYENSKQSFLAIDADVWSGFQKNKANSIPSQKGKFLNLLLHIFFIFQAAINVTG